MGVGALGFCFKYFVEKMGQINKWLQGKMGEINKWPQGMVGINIVSTKEVEINII